MIIYHYILWFDVVVGQPIFMHELKSFDDLAANLDNNIYFLKTRLELL